METYLVELEKQPFFGGKDIEGSVRWYINLKKLQASARNFVDSARAAITDETKSYFEEVKFPNLNIKGT